MISPFLTCFLLPAGRAGNSLSKELSVTRQMVLHASGKHSAQSKDLLMQTQQTLAGYITRETPQILFSCGAS